MTHCTLSRRILALAVAGTLVAAIGFGCSSSRPSQPAEEPQEEAPQGPNLLMLYTSSDAGLVLHDARRDSTQLLVSNAEYSSARSVSPSGRYLAFSYATPDSSHLGLLDLETGALEPLHTVSGDAVYSLAWHTDQARLAFGHYRPTDSGGRGPGGIRVGTPDGSTRSVGCSAAREVLDWLPNGTLATRTDDNLYVVASSDCATRTSIDARRMHHVTYAPDGRQAAYIHRELKYDRSANEYVPDSSLVLSDARGNNAETLFGNERHPRHLQWAPDASELAFDVQPEDSDHRQVVIYTGERTVYLVPPAETTADQVKPRWSPASDRLAFTLRTESGPRAAVRIKGQTRQLGPVRGAVWGWVDRRSLVVPGPDSVRVQNVNGTTSFAHPRPASLIHVWRRPVS